METAVYFPRSHFALLFLGFSVVYKERLGKASYPLTSEGPGSAGSERAQSFFLLDVSGIKKQHT